MLATWSYKERGTFYQRLDPRARIVFALTTTVATSFIWDLRLILIPFGLAILQLVASRVTWRELGRFWIFVTLLFAVLSLITFLTGRGGAGVYTVETTIWQGIVFGRPLTVSAERLTFLVTQLVRLFTMTSLVVVLPFTIHPATYGVVFRRLGLSDNLSFALELAVRFVPSLARDFTTTLDAQRARGYELERAGGVIKAIRNTAPLVVPITISSILRGEDVVDAMNLHAFGTGPRTWVQEAHYRLPDLLLLGLTVVLLVGAIALRVAGQAGL